MFVFLGNKQICLIVSVGYFGIFTFLTHVLLQHENGFSHNEDKEAMTKKSAGSSETISCFLVNAHIKTNKTHLERGYKRLTLTQKPTEI